ncbi:LuxR C-terminal-related transcriptional regulator [Halobacillus litoralis]|uniref:response regulator transcription factor n=1 Tax=Halobacillus litoralis TaxID=45668 RepID=UPI001CD79E19|nr:LuxR C-terminal-related transcriptional regulator [Halobacillus litoralis]MCA0972281.1 LuxR C-terminal-related transcriptional regulator [Halobacillus litoralis]
MDFVQSFTFSDEELEDIIFAIETTLYERNYESSSERSTRLNETLRMLKIHSPKHDLEKTKKKKLLSHREEEIFDLLMLGKSNEEMARFSHISEQTVKSHLKNIYSKLNVKNKVELILTYHIPQI